MFKMDGTGIYVGMQSTAETDFFVEHLGATYSKAKNHCRLPRTMGVMGELFNKVPRLRQSQEFINAGFDLKRERDEVLARKAADIEYDQADPLRYYQRQDVDFLVPTEAAGIFNEPRTGKTPTTLELMREKGTKLNLVISPASLVETWAMQVRTWFPEATPYTLIGSKGAAEIITEASKATGVRVVIISKNSLQRMPETFFKTNWDLAAVDEAHFLRNHQSIQSSLVYKVKAKHRYALTGTPTVSNTDDIYGIMRFLYPKQFTSYWSMIDRYFEKEFNMYQAAEKAGKLKESRKEEFQELIGLHSVSRKRKEVMPWLPEKQYTKLYAAMDEKQNALYRDMEDVFFAEDGEGTLVDAPSVLVKIIRMRQLAIDPRMLGFKGVGCKTDILLKYLADRKADAKTSPVVVMSMFTSYLKILWKDLVKKGYRVGMLHGEMTAKEKQAAANEFQAGEYDVLLCNTISAGTGWTLDAGDTVIFMDTAWTPTDQTQAEDRVTPTVPERLHDHNIVHIITAGSVDLVMHKMLERKEDLTAIINNGSRELIQRLMGELR